MSFEAMWRALEPVGRDGRSGGYRRHAWTGEDATLREWFAGEAAARGLDLVTDRVNAIPSQVTGWLDARGADTLRVPPVTAEQPG